MYMFGWVRNAMGCGNQYPEVGCWVLRRVLKVWMIVSDLDAAT